MWNESALSCCRCIFLHRSVYCLGADLCRNKDRSCLSDWWAFEFISALSKVSMKRCPLGASASSRLQDNNGHQSHSLVSVKTCHFCHLIKTVWHNSLSESVDPQCVFWKINQHTFGLKLKKWKISQRGTEEFIVSLNLEIEEKKKWGPLIRAVISERPSKSAFYALMGSMYLYRNIFYVLNIYVFFLLTNKGFSWSDLSHR